MALDTEGSAEAVSAKDEIEAFSRQLLDTKLSQCTEEQRALFAKLFPGKVRSDQLLTAIDLCDRTLQKNGAPKP